MTGHNEEYVYCDLAGASLEPQSAVIVVFGATGDLSRRKIFPALYNLERMGILAAETVIIGFARRELSGTGFAAQMREDCARYSHSRPLDELAWERLERRMRYHRGTFDDPAAFKSLADVLSAPGMPGAAIFYLAVAPEEFTQVTLMLHAAGLGSADAAGAKTTDLDDDIAMTGFRRLVVEKPFGSDRTSARLLNNTLQSCFAEDDIFRIDHYLGKETVQNLLYFRFANSIFEPLWNRQHIKSVEIDVLETGGIGTRAGYYDKAGAARDMIQNHLIQLLCLVAMEPPAGLEPESVRDEKVKVLKSIRDYSRSEYLSRSVRGQYAAGTAADGGKLPSYVDEDRVAPGSTTETYVSLKLEVDNWRFAGVPFTLRTGKALDRQVSEIRVTFQKPPATLFAGYCGDLLAPNVLTLRIQPDEGMWLGFNAKQPGAARVVHKELRFAYRERNDAYFPEAYERLIADALAGDSTLFIRADEADEAWRIVDALEAAWKGGPAPLPYAAGSSGPTVPAPGYPG